MNIIIVSLNISTSGGTERALCNLANSLVEIGYNVCILSICSNQNDTIYYTFSTEVQILHCNIKSIPLSIINKPLWFFNTYKRLKNILKVMTVDILIGAGHNQNVFLPFLKNKNTKIIGCEHLVFNSLPMISKIYLYIIYRYLDALVVLSTSSKKSYERINSNIHIIPNMIPFYPNHIEAERDNRIIMVGRLSPEKGYDRLINIAKKIKFSFPDWRIDIFGDGKLYSELSDKFADEDLNDFIFLKGNSKNIEEEYMNSSIFLMVSYFEAFPMVLLEAKSYALPVVAYNCPDGPKEIIKHNIDGFLIDENSEQSMINSLLRLISDKKMRIELGMQGRKNVEIYKQSNVAVMWLNMFNSLRNYK